MGKIKFYAVLIVIFLIGTIFGFSGGAKYASRSLHREGAASPEIDVAFIAAQEANWLAGLRFNEKTNVIVSLENALDAAVDKLAIWDSSALPSQKVRKERDGWLAAVKIYRKYYPSHGQNADEINAFLSKVPSQTQNSDYFNYVFRLAELHSANLSETNAP
jgi:hypothetical protein